MKKNVQTQQGMKNRFSFLKNLPIFSLCSMFLFFMLLHSTRMQGQTQVNNNFSEALRSLVVEEICQGDFYQGIQYNNVDTVIIENSSGDSTMLIVHPVYTIDQHVSICQGESYTFCGNNYTTSGLYTCNLQTQFGCDSIINLYLVVSMAPIPHIYEIANNFEVCGGEFSFCNTEQNKSNYEWNVVGGNVVAPWNYTTNQPILDSTWIFIQWDTVNIVSNASISVNYTNSFGCSAVQPTTYHGTVGQPEYIVVNLPTDSLCEGENYDQNGFFLYNLQAGVYNETVHIPLTTTPCGGDTVKNITLVVLPNPDIYVLPYDTTIYAGLSVQLDVINNVSGQETQYFWNWINGGSDQGESIIVSPLTNTTYFVTAYNSIGCTDIANAFVKIMTFFDKPDSLMVVNDSCRPVLTWLAPDTTFGYNYPNGFLGYNIYRDGEFIARVGRDVLTFTDVRLGEGTYEYCVRALYVYPYDPTTTVESEAECFAYTVPIPEYFPAPKDVYAYPSYDCSVVVIWEAPDETCWGNIVGYNVYRNLKENAFEKQWLNLPATKLYFIDEDLHIKNVTYTYCVQAIYEDFDGVSNIDEACASTTINCGLAINVYPNPADKQVTVVANDMDYIKVYNILGKYITTVKVPVELEHCNMVTIPTAGYEMGTYLLKIYFKEDAEGNVNTAVRRVSIVHW